MITVDVPEPIGSENSIGPFTFSQLIRVLFYSFPIVIFSIYISFILLVLIPIPAFLVWKKYNQNDLDIFLVKGFIWNLMPKRKERSKVLDFINLKTNSRNATVWEYYEGYMCALETSGLSIEFMDENEKNVIYDQFCNFLNSLDFGLSIYIYSYRERKEIKFDAENEFLKKVAESQKQLLNYYNSRVLKKKFIIVLALKYGDSSFNYRPDLKKASEMLNERANLVINSLSTLNLMVKRLQFYEYSEIYSDLW